MNVIIVDDDRNAREELKRCMEYYSEKYSCDFSVREFSDGDSFLVKYEPGCDIVFMDIEMPGTDGLETARRLRRTDGQVVIVFVTNIAGHAVSGYEVGALDYIVKPVDRYAFSMKMQRAVSHALQNRDDFIQIRESGDIVMIKLSSVKYLESSGHHVIYHTVYGRHREYTTIREAALKTGGRHFVWLGRSYYVNMRYIDRITGDEVRMGQDSIVIPKAKRKGFLEKFTDYISGGTGV